MDRDTYSSPGSSESGSTLDRVNEQRASLSQEEIHIVNQLREVYLASRQHRQYAQSSTTGIGGAAAAASSSSRQSNNLGMSDLEVGKLLNLANRLNEIVDRIDRTSIPQQESARSHGQQPPTHPVMVLVWSCYSGLGQIYRRILEVLAQIQRRTQQYHPADRTEPNLVIDGFGGSAQDNQVRLVIQMCGQTLEMIRRRLRMP